MPRCLGAPGCRRYAARVQSPAGGKHPSRAMHNSPGAGEISPFSQPKWRSLMPNTMTIPPAGSQTMTPWRPSRPIAGRILDNAPVIVAACGPCKGARRGRRDWRTVQQRTLTVPMTRLNGTVRAGSRTSAAAKVMLFQASDEKARQRSRRPMLTATLRELAAPRSRRGSRSRPRDDGHRRGRNISTRQ